MRMKKQNSTRFGSSLSIKWWNHNTIIRPLCLAIVLMLTGYCWHNFLSSIMRTNNERAIIMTTPGIITIDDDDNNNNNNVPSSFTRYHHHRLIQPQQQKQQQQQDDEEGVVDQHQQLPEFVPPLIQQQQQQQQQVGVVANNSNDSLLDGNIISITRSQRRKVLYFITPTYERPTQVIDLIRLRQTLELAILQGYHSNIYWIVVEDSKNCTSRVRNIIQNRYHVVEDADRADHADMDAVPTIPFAHIAVPTPRINKERMAHRGIVQRNAALQFIEEHPPGDAGVVYFGDDDNAYDVQLFTELSYVRSVGVLGVGFVGGGAYERCRVDPTTGYVDALLTNWNPTYPIQQSRRGQKGQQRRQQQQQQQTKKREYPIDMAGFAFSTIHLLARQEQEQEQQQQQYPFATTPKVTPPPRKMKLRFRKYSKPGFLESDFIQEMIGPNNVRALEPLAANCTKILVWHVKTGRT